MANSPAVETVIHEPTGKVAGSVTKATRLGAAEGGAVGTLFAYLLLKTGIETDASMAVLIGGALATVVAVIITHFKGKNTPTDQVREKETVVDKPVPNFVPQGVATADGVPVSVAAGAYEPKHRADTA
jgi:hypothetical protein